MTLLNNEVMKHKELITDILPKGVDKQKFLLSVEKEINRNQLLQKCSPASVTEAIIKAAKIGVDLDAEKGQAFLVTYKNCCKMILGYKGLIMLALRNKDIVHITTHNVHEGDELIYQEGLTPKLEHFPNLKAPGELIAIYAIATLPHQKGKLFKLMSIEELKQIQEKQEINMSPQKLEHCGWRRFPEAMQKKTVIRKLLNEIHTSSTFQDTLTEDFLAETQDQDTDEVNENPKDEDKGKKYEMFA
jgi:recombination protein RecT